jgi:hypothetical protein
MPEISLPAKVFLTKADEYSALLLLLTAVHRELFFCHTDGY